MASWKEFKNGAKLGIKVSARAFKVYAMALLIAGVPLGKNYIDHSKIIMYSLGIHLR